VARALKDQSSRSTVAAAAFRTIGAAPWAAKAEAALGTM